MTATTGNMQGCYRLPPGAACARMVASHHGNTIDPSASMDIQQAFTTASSERVMAASYADRLAHTQRVCAGCARM